jgi:hypothetical protein
MRLAFPAKFSRAGCLLAALIVSAPATLGAPAQAEEQSQAASSLSAQSPDFAEAMAKYRRDLAEYLKARASYEVVAEPYWKAIAEKRRVRARKRAIGEPLSLDDYVLVQPPVYFGPPRPHDPSKPREEVPPALRVPVVTDFLAAARREFQFVPRLPKNEAEFKRAYAATALAAGLSPDQVVRIYGFEAGGNGDYDVQAGREHNRKARAITTALGYNQLLATNTVEIIAETGRRFIGELAARAAQSPGGDTTALARTLATLRRMVSFGRSVPDSWHEHEILANTPKGLALHAMNLDVDVGPLLQTQKLLDSIVFARRKGYAFTLTAAELEMMNLTGDGNGFDMITMPRVWRDKVPTANFFQRRGYADNPVARRNNVVAKLIAATDARMNEEARKPGARELAAVLE